MGGDKQVTEMVLKVDLECHRCYKKIKKVLCKFPQVQDQTYDEKANTVTIKVISCNPEKIKQQIKCKGGDTIKCIVNKPPPPIDTKPETKPAPKPKPETKPAPKPKPETKPDEKPHPFRVCCPDCYKWHPGGPCFCRWVPVGPPPCYQYDWYYGRPVYDSYGGGRSYYVRRCDYFFEENAGACAIM